MLPVPGTQSPKAIDRKLKIRGAIRGLSIAFALIVVIYSAVSQSKTQSSRGISCVFQTDPSDYFNGVCGAVIGAGVAGIFLAALTLYLDITAERLVVNADARRRIHLVNFLSLALLSILWVSSTITATVFYSGIDKYWRGDMDRHGPPILVFCYITSVLTVVLVILEHQAMRSHRQSSSSGFDNARGRGTEDGLNIRPDSVNANLRRNRAGLNVRERKSVTFHIIFSIFALIISCIILIVIKTRVIYQRECGFDEDNQHLNFDTMDFFRDYGFYSTHYKSRIKNSFHSCDVGFVVSSICIAVALIFCVLDWLLIRGKIHKKIHKKITFSFFSFLSAVMLCLWIGTGCFIAWVWGENRNTIAPRVEGPSVAAIVLCFLLIPLWVLLLSISAYLACKRQSNIDTSVISANFVRAQPNQAESVIVNCHRVSQPVQSVGTSANPGHPETIHSVPTPPASTTTGPSSNN
eukprot:m.78007 g.78007  ORF g.78007 m.78007 type:complete len:464 (+) comp36084_c0_seq1:73-1464(+)